MEYLRTTGQQPQESVDLHPPLGLELLKPQRVEPIAEYRP
jgi:hypothetical protein